MPRPALMKLAKLVADDLNEGQISGGLQTIGETLASAPETIPELLGLMAKEARKKKPDDALLEAFAFMVGQALEILRYGVERNSAEALHAVSAAQAHIRSLVLEGKLDSGTLFLMLRQFTDAKLELPDDLRDVMAGMIGQEPVSVLPGKTEIDEILADMARACGGDVFALHTELAGQTSALPEPHRVGIVAALLGAPDPALRDAAIGWLLDEGAVTRRGTAGLLQQAADGGYVSPTMLRRMIAIRNWLPEGDRPLLDAVIQTCREKDVACAPPIAAMVRGVAVTGIDGSGAQSLFVTIKDGHRQAVAGILLKQGTGVRDAWVNAGLTKTDVDLLMLQVKAQSDYSESGIGYVHLALAHALAEAGTSGVLPPFGLLDVVERAGLATLNPDAMPVERLVARLLADIPAARKTAAAIAQAIADSAAWENDFPVLDSWFEDDGAIAALLSGKRLSTRRRVILLLHEYLPARRARWAARLAWTALTLQQDRLTGDGWMNFALVAGELLGDRPLADIPVMTMIARKSVEAWAFRSR